MERSFSYTEENAKGLFELLEGAESIARMTFSRIDPNNVIIDHTEVAPNAKGTGAGKAIVAEMVRWARAKNQKVLPLCTFANAMLERNKDWQDIIRK